MVRDPVDPIGIVQRTINCHGDESIKFKISQYLNNFSTKLSDSVLEEFSKIINQDARGKQ